MEKVETNMVKALHKKLAACRRVFFLLLFFLGGCASVSPILPPQAKALKLDVPFVSQDAAHCGPAALASALQYYAVPTTLNALVDEVYVPGRKGSLTLEMTAATRRNGLLPYPIEPSLDALLQELDAGHPVLVLQNLAFNWWPQWHYALVVGYSENGRTLLLHSGERPYYAIDAGTFMRTWARVDHWGLVLTPLDQIPQTAAALPYLNSIDKMRQTRTIGNDQLQVALSQAALHWPESPSAQFVYANWLLEQHQPGRAVEYYERGLSLQSDNPLALNNYAYALHAVGCRTRAQQIIDRVIQLAPGDVRFEESARELAGDELPGAPSAACAR
ncbi:PA2778 family cysteine peptidase [Litorivivens sp.]|uniref:PA2778 family cysteine peptidase n=1 Tax=Litorivivens sp. TaxID=2020868 RepID=UPI003564988D